MSLKTLFLQTCKIAPLNVLSVNSVLNCFIKSTPGQARAQRDSSHQDPGHRLRSAKSFTNSFNIFDIYLFLRRQRAVFKRVFVPTGKISRLKRNQRAVLRAQTDARGIVPANAPFKNLQWGQYFDLRILMMGDYFIFQFVSSCAGSLSLCATRGQASPWRSDGRTLWVTYLSFQSAL
jgi:hypothetical protein